MKRIRLIPLLILSAALTIVSCSQQTEPEEVYPQLPVEKVETAIAANHPNTTAQLVKVTVESFDFFNSFIIQPSGNGWTKNGNTWSFSTTGGGVTYTYRFVENADSYAYQYVISGNLDGITYTNFVYISGSIAKNGLTSEWELYDSENGTDGWVATAYDYYKNSSTKEQTITYKVYSSDNHEQVSYDYYATVKNDKSGSYVYYLGGSAKQEAIWAANGSGLLKDYSGESTVTEEWEPNP